MMTINTVVAAISGDHEDDQLSIRVACDIARSSGASLHLVHSWNIGLPPLWPGYSGDLTDPERLAGWANTVMEKTRVRTDEVLGRRSLAHVEEGRPEAVIVRVAEEVHADLIVVRGNVRHGTLGAIVGSVSEAVINRATCPVLLIHGEVEWPPREVVACFDDSSESEYALDVARGLATAMALPLRSVRVMPGPHRPHLSLEDRPHSGPVPRPEILHGHPGEELHRFLGDRPVALIAMGTRGKGALPLTHIGSVATHLLRTTTAAILIVSPKALPEPIQVAGRTGVPITH